MTAQPQSMPAIEANKRNREFEDRLALVTHIRNGSTDMMEVPRLIPPEVYTDPVRWEAERRILFRGMPLLACLSQDIPEPGNMFLFDAVGPSTIIVRGRDGRARAFRNMCMHRAARLVSDCSSRKRLTCPFHGWTYDLEGKLVGVPRREAFDADDLDTRNLVSMPIGEWGGMIFVKQTPGNDEIDVQTYLGDFAEVMLSLSLDRAVPVKHDRLDFPANWKYALDTYNEVYHLSVLHAKTAGGNFFPDLMSARRSGRNHCQSFAPKSLAAALKVPESEWGDLAYAPNYFLFPNISINTQRSFGFNDFVQIHRIYPGDAIGNGCTFVSSYNIGEVTDGQMKEKLLDMHHFIMNDVVNAEDYSVSRDGYNNLCEAPPDFNSVLGRNELLTYYTQRNIAEAIGMPFD